MILRRLPDSRFSEVRPLWRGETVVVIGCGPSLTLGDVEFVRRAREAGQVRCVVVNDAFLWAPWADVHYAADSKWHEWMAVGIAKPRLGLTSDEVRGLWQRFSGQKCSIEWSGNNIKDDRVHMLRNRDSDVHGMGLSPDPKMLATGRNSGAQALNLTVLAGASRIALLGFDGRPGFDASHFHGGHPTTTPQAVWPYIRESFIAIARDLPDGVAVMNCSPGSAIDAFPRRMLGEALAELECV